MLHKKAEKIQSCSLTLRFLCLCFPADIISQKDNVLQARGEVTADEGHSVTLDCLYNTTSSDEYLFWYKQEGNKSFKFILSRFKLGEGKTEDEEKYSSTLDSSLRSVPLKIQKLELSDSAVYYCALQPTAVKMIDLVTLVQKKTHRTSSWTYRRQSHANT
uniref:Ig-like domain-containing protein n=1 Tax=Salarias fasciatus TaxID=181472 RepID=A0A672H6Q1_SALFA